jgi:hypothetical protein
MKIKTLDKYVYALNAPTSCRIDFRHTNQFTYSQTQNKLTTMMKMIWMTLFAKIVKLNEQKDKDIFNYRDLGTMVKKFHAVQDGSLPGQNTKRFL